MLQTFGLRENSVKTKFKEWANIITKTSFGMGDGRMDVLKEKVVS